MRIRLAWLALGIAAGLLGCEGADRPPGEIAGPRRPEATQRARQSAQDDAKRAVHRSVDPAGSVPDKRILFGDLHVHTTYSIDAFFFSMPLFAGEGAHPPADACDFARHCAQLDFFSLNDHAEGITPEHWQATKDSLRECNERAGDPADPDMVGFVGWEWTQVGQTPETHWGHKNVIFPGLADEDLPARPINSDPDDGTSRLFSGLSAVGTLRFLDPLGWDEYSDFKWMADRLGGLATCPRGVDTRELPFDCRENAATPEVLFEKLGQWGFETLVIPHGTTWGFYTPRGSSMDKQLTATQHDPEMQRLIEIFSGHGNSEEYRPWRSVEWDAEGGAICPEPTADFMPCCWRAGEIVRERCQDLPEDECARRIEEAKRVALEADTLFPTIFPDTRAEDWQDCDQCRDCFKPSLALRPAESAQYTMAIQNFDESDAGGDPLRFRFGFISASDNHTARPGTGYKQYARRMMTEATGLRSSGIDAVTQWVRRRAGGDPQQATPPAAPQRGFLGVDAERVASFLYPGGLVAVHAEDRGRRAIWDALERREVYGTSGPRILLWFDLLNADRGTVPMGSGVELAVAPRFQVRAVGSFVQKPGCPADSTAALPPERLEYLCRGECYNPGDARHAIEAIEIVRIRPQTEAGESVDPLIEDPWRRFECEPDPAGCIATFEDDEYVTSGRDAVYYARVLQEETPAVNGENLRTVFDDSGAVVSTDPCYGDSRTSFDDDCLAPVQERAWSSPIFVDRPPGAAPDTH